MATIALTAARSKQTAAKISALANPFQQKVVTVFCSASQKGMEKNSPLITQSRRLGELFAQHNIPVQTGGKSRSFMYAVSDGVTSKGGKLIGTSTKFLAFQREKIDADDIALKIFAGDMQARKLVLCTPRMIVQAPGGIGTLDEISDAAIMMAHGPAFAVAQEKIDYTQVLKVVRFGKEMHQVDDDMFKAAVDRGDISPKFLPIFETVDTPEQVLEALAVSGGKTTKDLGWLEFNQAEVMAGMPSTVKMHFNEEHNGFEADMASHAGSKLEAFDKPAIAIWGGSRDEGLTVERMDALDALAKYIKQNRLPVVHSGQKGHSLMGGLKQHISMVLRDRRINELSLVAEPIETAGFATGLSRRQVVLPCEAAIDQTVKRIAPIIVLFGLSLDTLDKLTEYQTEVDTRESDLMVIAYNGDGSFDKYKKLIEDRYDRGFVSPRTKNNIVYPTTPAQLVAAVQLAVGMRQTAGPNQRVFSFAEGQKGEEGALSVVRAVEALRARGI